MEDKAKPAFPPLPNDLKLDFMYMEQSQIIGIAHDTNCVYHFYWDGASVSYHLYEARLLIK